MNNNVLLKDFNNYLEDLYNNWNIDPQLRKAMNYSLLGGGKRLRPLLFFCFLKSFQMDQFNKYFPAAASIEMIQTYSLIHDDLPAMDNDDLRRGKPSSHVKFGEDLAILAGDGLLTDAFKVVLETPINSSQKVSLVNYLSVAAGSLNMVTGQVEDLGIAKHFHYPIDQMFAHKTAAMFKVTAEFASTILNLSDNDHQMVCDFAEKFGIAFQLVDDLHDYPEELGSPNNYVAVFGKEATINKLKELEETAFMDLSKIELASFKSASLKDFWRVLE